MKNNIFLLFFLSIFPLLANSQDEAETSESSVAPLVEQDMILIKSEIRQHEENIRTIESLSVATQSVSTQKTEPKLGADKQWEKARAALNALKQEGNKSLGKDLKTLIDSSQESLSNVFNASDELQKILGRSILFSRSNAEDKFSRDPREATNKVLQKYYDDLVSKANPIVILFDSNFTPSFELVLMDPEEISKEQITEMAAKLEPLLKKDLSTAFREIQDEYLSKVLEAKSAADAAFKTMKQTEEAKIKEKERSLDAQIAKFKKIQAQESRKEKTDQSLVYAVYGMIAVLLLLFLSLKVFTDEVAKALIERRSLVEVVGMAFMLITIIILGTGQKISNEILGTLLGTIAGYVFARGTDDKKRTEEH